MKIVSGVLGGLLIGILASFVVGLAVIPAFVGQGNAGGMVAVGPITILCGIVVGIIIGVTAPSAAKAWRRVLIVLALLCFVLPLAGIVFTGGMVSAVADKAGGSAAAGAGAAIGGTIVSGFLGFVGFFLGAIFLVIGLLIGRDKQVVYVQAPPPAQPPPGPNPPR